MVENWTIENLLTRHLQPPLTRILTMHFLGLVILNVGVAEH